jgi:WD40 repeat protein
MFNKDESRILTWSWDGTARLWQADTSELLIPALRHEGAVRGAMFSKDESWILTWSNDNTARLWQTETGQQLGPALLHSKPVNGAVFSRDESRILTWSADGTARSWDISYDADFPKNIFRLQTLTLTGIELNPATREIKCLEKDKWEELAKEYFEAAANHYKTCRYPEYNLWRRFFPEEALKIRPTVE